MRRALAIVALSLVCTVSASGSTPSARVVFNQPGGSSFDIVETDADATSYLNLTPGEQAFYAGDQDGSWSPEGSEIVFTSHRDSNVSTEIYVMSADGSAQRRLTTDGPEGVQNVGGQVFDSSPVWGPGGAVLAYIKSVASADDVWLMRPDGIDQRRITADGGHKSFLAWQPIGSRLVYAEGGGIFTLLEGDPPVRIATGGEPAWSPDGKRILYTATDGLWTIGANGRDPVHVTAIQAQNPTWSPDGSHVAFVGTRVFPELTSRFGLASRQDLYTVGADGSYLRRLTGPEGDAYSTLPTGNAPTWWPDGSRLFFLSQRSYSEPSTTYVMNADGSCEGKFAETPAPLLRPVWRPGSQPGLGPIKCADLRLTLDTSVGSVSPAALGQDARMRFFLDNDGSETATGVRVELKTTDPSATLTDANNGALSCSGTRYDLVCTLDALPARAPRAVSFAMRSDTAGYIPLTITATATEPDSDPTTNSIQTSKQVLPCTKVGTYLDDILYGTPVPDRICGLPGADHIYGLAGNDYLDGGSGADIIVGGPGRDMIMGGGGNDVIYARDGRRGVIDCGTEKDVAIADRLDAVSHCETGVRPKR